MYTQYPFIKIFLSFLNYIYKQNNSAEMRMRMMRAGKVFFFVFLGKNEETKNNATFIIIFVRCIF